MADGVGVVDAILAVVGGCGPEFTSPAASGGVNKVDLVCSVAEDTTVLGIGGLDASAVEAGGLNGSAVEAGGLNGSAVEA